MACRETTPYSRVEPLKVRCVGLRTSVRSITFKAIDGVILPDKKRVTQLAALWNGKKTYISTQGLENLAFEEDVTYLLRNYTLGKKYGKEFLSVDHRSSIYKTSPLPMTEIEKETAMEVLLPASKEKSGEEYNLYAEGGYVTLLGQITNLKSIRMTSFEAGQVPVLDLDLCCGATTHNITLWRDEALVPLHIDDEITITHLRPSSSSGQKRLNSSSYTTITVVEQKSTEQDITVIAISEKADGFYLLTEDLKEYTMSSDVSLICADEILSKLPLTLKVVHLHRKISHVEGLPMATEL